MRSVFILILIALASLPSNGAVTYVDAAATGANDGSSWANAFDTIQAGVDAANASGGGEVWVKAGTYSGCTNANPSDSFEALDPNAVDIMGEEKDLYYTTNGTRLYAHITMAFLTGSVTVAGTLPGFGSTTDVNSFTARLLDLRDANPDALLFVNHPSDGARTIQTPDLLEAANAGVLRVMELLRQRPDDLVKWDYLLANLDDQAGDCSKMVWGICSADLHHAVAIDYKVKPSMIGMIPTVDQDPAYSNRRLAFADMIRRGSMVSMATNFRCGMPTYSMESSEGTAASINVSMQADNIGGAPWVEMRFYGCDWQTGTQPGTLLYTKRMNFGSVESVTYYLTQTGAVGGIPLTAQQKANIKYIRPMLATSASAYQHTYMQPVRIRSTGSWWNGPAVTLAGHQATVGPSPYPSGGDDTGATVFFNTHSHTLGSDGDSAPPSVRRAYWDMFRVLGGPEALSFDIVTDHEARTPFCLATSSVVALKEGVHLYGGFAGDETSKDQRDWQVNHSIIDAQNLGRCIYCNANDWTDRANATIDGFVLKRGRVDEDCGGGLCNWKSSMAVRNCTFSENFGTFGGAMSNSSGTPSITDCVFSANQNFVYGSRGGAIMNDAFAKASITRCTFQGNCARRAGAVFEGGTESIITDCDFVGNTAVNTTGWIGYHGLGGAIYCLRSTTKITNCRFEGNNSATIGNCRGGAVYVEDKPSPTFERCTFTGNSVTGPNGRGGAMYIWLSTPKVLGCVFTGNSAPANAGLGGAVYVDGLPGAIVNWNTFVANTALQGGGIYTINSSPLIANNIVAFNSTGIERSGESPTLKNNDFFGNTIDYVGIGAGSGDISADPLFVDKEARNYHLTAVSPCINAGTSVPDVPAFDMDGEGRIYGSARDIGADEYWSTTVPLTAIKTLADETDACLEGLTVSAVFDDFFYVEAGDRSSGIRVNKEDHDAQIGMTVKVCGTVRTNDDGERYIEADTASEDGEGTVNSLFLLSRSIGGGDWMYDPATGTGQKGIAGAVDLNNIGLLVSTSGRVTYSCASYFYIDDGSALQDGSGYLGVRVLPYDLAVPPATARVRVTGVSSCFKLNGNIRRLIRATSLVDYGQ